MGGVEPLKVPPPASMAWSDNFRFNPKVVNISLPKIIEYLPLEDSSTWTFHVTVFVTLISGKVKSTLTFRLLVIVPADVCHCIVAFYLGSSFLLSLLLQMWN